MSDTTASHSTSRERETISLARARIGDDLEIRCVEGPSCEELRRLGFCESLPVRKLTEGRNLLCSVCGARIAVSRRLADQVKVSPAKP